MPNYVNIDTQTREDDIVMAAHKGQFEKASGLIQESMEDGHAIDFDNVLMDLSPKEAEKLIDYLADHHPDLIPVIGEPSQEELNNFDNLDDLDISDL